MLVCPTLELLIFAEQESERLADDVGRVRVNEFRVPVQATPDHLLQTDLRSCRFRLL